MKKLHIVGGKHYYNGNHDQEYTSPTPLHEVVTGNEILFVEVEEGANRGDKYKSVCVFKAPNFAAHWATIEEADVKRWKE